MLLSVQVRQLSATALVGVEARPVPDMASLRQLATHIETVVKAQGGSFIQAENLIRAAKAASMSLSSAASNSSMYV